MRDGGSMEGGKGKQTGGARKVSLEDILLKKCLTETWYSFSTQSPYCQRACYKKPQKGYLFFWDFLFSAFLFYAIKQHEMKKKKTWIYKNSWKCRGGILPLSLCTFTFKNSLLNLRNAQMVSKVRFSFSDSNKTSAFCFLKAVNFNRTLARMRWKNRTVKMWKAKHLRKLNSSTRSLIALV